MCLRSFALALVTMLAGAALIATLDRQAHARAGQAAASDAAKIAPHFSGLNGTFVLLDPESGQRVVHNPSRAAERFAPCSTFKIPNSAIALETGVAGDAGFTLPYQAGRDLAEKGWPEIWRRDHDLRSAIRFSVVWYYQELARRIGAERMPSWLDRLEYGNRDISAGIDSFWLGKSLAISADEQVVFLRKLDEGRFGLSPRTTSLLKEILVRDRGADFVLHEKTGACANEKGAVVWNVGFVKRGPRTSYYALNLGGPDFTGIFEKRLTLHREVLAEFGLVPVKPVSPQ